MAPAITNLLIPLGILPAIASIYIMVGRYEEKFKDKLVLFSFIGGMGLGLILYILTAYSFPEPYLDEIVVYSIIYAFIEFLEKTAALKLKMFGSPAIPIYGGSVGAGMAAIFAPVFIKSLDLSFASIMFATLPIAVIFISTSTGIMIGAGIKKKQRNYFLYSFIITLITWIFLILSLHDIRFFFFLLIIAVISYHYSLKRILPLTMLKRAELKELL